MNQQATHPYIPETNNPCTDCPYYRTASCPGMNRQNELLPLLIYGATGIPPVYPMPYPYVYGPYNTYPINPYIPYGGFSPYYGPGPFPYTGNFNYNYVDIDE